MAFTKVTNAGIGSTNTVLLHNLNVVGTVTATDGIFSGIGSFGGNVTIGGTLTYEDVTNVDAVGVITARNGISVLGAGVTIAGGGLNVTAGVSTFGGNIKVGTGITLSPDGDVYVTGVSTFAAVSGTTGTFSGNITANGNIVGDNSTDLSGINDITASMLSISDTITHTGDTNTKIRFPAADTITAETAGSEKFRITSDGDVTITSADAGATGPTLKLTHNSASPADNDIIGVISMDGDDDAGNATEFASIYTKVTDVSNSSETGHLAFKTRALSSYNEIFRLAGRSSASAPSYTTDDINGIILDVYNTGNPYPRYMNFIAKSGGDTDTNIGFWTEAVGGSPTEKLRITSAGALLVGTTSPHYPSGDMQNEIRKDNNRTYTSPLMVAHPHLLLNNSDTTDNSFTGLGFRAGSGDGSIGYVYRGSANNSDFVINTDGNANGVERFRIFNNGSVLIGALSGEAAGGSSSGGGARLVIDCQGLDINDGVADATNYGLVFANDPTSNKANGIGFFNDGGTGCGGYIVHQDKGGNNIGDIVFGTAETSDTPVERMRLANNGHLSVSSTGYMGSFSTTQGQSSFGHNIQSGGRSNRQISANSTGAEIMNVNNTIQAGAACSILQYRTLNSVEGSIVANGNGLSISNNSDYRKKERITDLTGSLAVLNTLRPRQYYYRDGFGKDTKAFAGFIAHELQSTALPHLTTGVKDAVVTQADKDNDLYGGMSVGDPIWQTVAYSDNELITHLVKAVQELSAEVETLKTKVAALESS